MNYCSINRASCDNFVSYTSPYRFKVNGIIEVNGFVSLTIKILQPIEQLGKYILKVLLKQHIMIFEVKDLFTN